MPTWAETRARAWALKGGDSVVVVAAPAFALHARVCGRLIWLNTGGRTFTSCMGLVFRGIKRQSEIAFWRQMLKTIFNYELSHVHSQSEQAPHARITCICSYASDKRLYTFWLKNMYNNSISRAHHQPSPPPPSTLHLQPRDQIFANMMRVQCSLRQAEEKRARARACERLDIKFI